MNDNQNTPLSKEGYILVKDMNEALHDKTGIQYWVNAGFGIAIGMFVVFPLIAALVIAVIATVLWTIGISYR